MTREDAIKELTELLPEEFLMDYADAIKMGIEALEQEPCGDCIDRKETLKALMDEWTEYDAELIDCFIEKIKKLPSVTQQPCEDAVSRQELLKAISTWDKFGCDTDTKLVPYKDHYVPYIHYDDVINCIKCMPSVSAQPKKWIPIETELPEVGIDVLVCDMEGTIYLSHRSSFDYYFDEWGNKIKNIRAWMPLPEPYKEEGSDKE